MSFDLDTYRSLSAKLVTDDIDFSSFREQPLSPDALRCLRYVRDVESHTVCYLRDILVTQTPKDPDLTLVPDRVERREVLARRGHRRSTRCPQRVSFVCLAG
jgi:hypothetical protein